MKQNAVQRYPDTQLLGEVFNAKHIDQIQGALRDEIDWQMHVNQNARQGAWDVLALRCMQRHATSHPILQCFSHEDSIDQNSWVNLAAMRRYPVVNQILNCFQCPIKSVRFMRLQSGANILPHQDSGLSLEFGEARLHVPIASDSNVCFFVSGVQVQMNIGELWYIDANKQHWVINQSLLERIHLVIDCVSNDWLSDKIRKSNHLIQEK